MRFAYFYFMKAEPDRVRGLAEKHAAYWRKLALPGYLGGPFADRSGGLVTFDAGSLQEAEHLAAADPFGLEGLIEQHWLKEWQARADRASQCR